MLLIIMKRGDSWMLPLPIETDGTIYKVPIIIIRGEAVMLPISIVAGGTIYTWWEMRWRDYANPSLKP